MVTCGPSIYRKPHIGNYRTFLYEDILQRYLEYNGYEVLRLITITDIEDKAIIEAQKEEMPIKKLVEKNRALFLKDFKLLRMKSPTYSSCMMVCSSTAIEKAAQLIKTLLEKGHAYHYTYKSRDNIYFDPLKFAEFGKLSKLNIEKWPKRKRRFHKDTYERSTWNKGDFILWHGYKKGDSDYWNTEIGKGRPAWNIQDAASIAKYLGLSVDVACGGIDNLTRHHDYTVAIIEGITGREFAHYWFHGEHLLVNSKKMSKSRGNVFYPNDLTRMGYKGDYIRFFLIYGHYRKRLNFTLEKIRKASQKLDTFKNMVSGLMKAKSNISSSHTRPIIEGILPSFEKHMNDDLNVKAAFDDLFSIISKLEHKRFQGKMSASDSHKAVSDLRKIDNVLQVIF